MSKTKARGVRKSVKDEPVEEYIIEDDQSINVSAASFPEIELSDEKDNREKTRAYNRKYSAKLRADPVKRQELNEKKKESMRRLAERRRTDVDAPKPVPRKRKEQEEEVAKRKEPKKRDHVSYYAKNVESMRMSNRKYTAKVRADPEKRAALNEKKKLAMRRLKQRRLLEASGQSGEELYYEVVAPDRVPLWEREDVVGKDEVEEEVVEEDPLTETIYCEQVVEEIIIDEGALEIEQELIREEFSFAEDSMEYYEAETEDQEINIEELLPFTINVFRSISCEEERTNFASYLEQCAREYYLDRKDEE